MRRRPRRRFDRAHVMSRKHAELEREFIDDLAPRTGRDLAQWMAAIDAAGLLDKNAIIDWLRPQGLTFAHASWLERIHNNSGRPIYLDTDIGGSGAAGAPVSLPVPSPPVANAAGTFDIQASPRPAPSRPPPRPPVPRPPAPPPAQATATASATSLESLLARGKGLRPLAEMLLREIAAALPETRATASGELVSICGESEIAALWIGPRELRLGLNLGDAPFEGMVQRARIAGCSPRITHMVVIADARQITAPLIDLVRVAAARTQH